MNTTIEPKVLVILGSSRENSNTLDVVRKRIPFREYELVQLRELQIAHFAYNHETGPQPGKEDDFLSIAHKMRDSDIIVFATPLYWYSMSSYMKVFFDRLTELLYVHKSIGKALKGKKTYLISAGGSPELPEGFEVPFRLTSEYFDMEFVQTIYEQRD
jgi:multimeric flavodoxin WrbA